MNEREILRKIVGVGRAAFALPCVVESVAGVFCDVVPVDTDVAPLKNVRLNAATGGLIVTPAVDSVVLVVMLSGTDAFVALFSEIEKVSCEVSGFRFEVSSAGKFKVENGNYGLRQAFEDIIAAIGRLTVTTGVGPSGPPVNVAEFEAVKKSLEGLME